jgi:hypothetical protein
MVVPFAKVRGYSTFQGYVIDENEDGISGAGVILSDCYDTIIGYTSTSSSGYYYFSVTLNGNSPYKLSAGKPRYTTEYITVYGTTTHTFEIEFVPERIAVFFWASDAGIDWAIDDYREILEDEGYTTIYEFKDTSDVEARCQTVDNYETDQDTIFVYIIGHGDYSWWVSKTWFKPDGSKTKSSTFKGYMDLWESPRKCILVESCESYTWADDFDESPYLAMSTSDKTHSSYTYNDTAVPYEGDFSHWFFEHVADGFNAVASFYYACGLITHTQNPQIRDYSSYVWFS